MVNLSSSTAKHKNSVATDTKTSIILSIRPQYSIKLMDGSKTVELRRRFPIYIPNHSRAYIYSTSPIRALVGSLEIAEVLRLPISTIWEQYKDGACVEKSAFDNYFSGLDEGFALEVSTVCPLPRSLSLSKLRNRFGFRPPQSFQYVKRELQTALQNEYSQISY